MTIRAAGIAMLLVACAGAGALAPAAVPVNGLQPEDRVLVGDFSRVTALAASTDRIYVVYPRAIAVWLALEHRWDIPRSPPNPDELRTVTSAVVDPVDRTLWLATPAGWLHYNAFANVWDVGLIAAAPPRLPRATTIDDAFRDIPRLRSLAPHLAQGSRLEPGVLTAAAPDPRGQGWYLGTSTRGLIFYDRLATDAAPLPLGLPGDAVGALAADGTSLWVVTDNDGVRPAAVTQLPDDLASPPIAVANGVRGALFDRAARAIPTADGIVIATDRGVVDLGRSGGANGRFTATGGLIDPLVTSVAEYRGAVVAGTRRGLAISTRSGVFAELAPTYIGPVNALLSARDTLWVGTPRGLLALAPGSDALRISDGFARLAGDGVDVVDVGFVADTLVALTPSQLLWRDPANGGWNEGLLLSNVVGIARAVATGRSGAWVAGDRGVALVGPHDLVPRYVVTLDMLPAPPTAVAVTGSYLWIGTHRGLVRFRLTSASR